MVLGTDSNCFVDLFKIAEKSRNQRTPHYELEKDTMVSINIIIHFCNFTRPISD